LLELGALIKFQSSFGVIQRIGIWLGFEGSRTAKSTKRRLYIHTINCPYINTTRHDQTPAEGAGAGAGVGWSWTNWKTGGGNRLWAVSEDIQYRQSQRR